MFRTIQPTASRALATGALIAMAILPGRRVRRILARPRGRLRPHRPAGARDLSSRRQAVRDRHARARVRHPHPQLHRPALARGRERRRRQCRHRRDGVARPVRVRHRARRLREHPGLAQGPERTAAFYFSDPGDSYASRTGRPDDLGVIGVALFRERERPAPYAYENHAPEAASSADAAARQGAAERQRTVGRASSGDGCTARHGTRPAGALAGRAGGIRARERVARRAHRDPVRPAREPGRDGRAAAGRSAGTSPTRSRRRSASCPIPEVALSRRPLAGNETRPVAARFPPRRYSTHDGRSTGHCCG